MKVLKRVLLVAVFLCMISSHVALANDWTWNSIAENANQSILLEEGVTSSLDVVHKYGRGDYLAEGSVRIANLQNGSLEIQAMTLAHVYVDRIIQTVFLDVWDEEDNDWICLNYWDFEIVKEEVENEQLHLLVSTLTLPGYEVGRYYRARGLHGVEIYDELEACATETDGVQLTDWRD